MHHPDQPFAEAKQKAQGRRGKLADGVRTQEVIFVSQQFIQPNLCTVQQAQMKKALNSQEKSSRFFYQLETESHQILAFCKPIETSHCKGFISLKQ